MAAIYRYLLTVFVVILLADDARIGAAELPFEIIDRHIDQKLDQAGVTPAEITTDEQFVRRVYLDLAGRIPTANERLAFVEDQQTDKRDRLVDMLLGGDDYPKHFASLFDVLMMGRTDEHHYNERVKHHWHDYLENVFRHNRRWDDVVREILLARPQSDDNRGAVWFLYERNNNHQAIAEAITTAVFGFRIDCAQCHDHMSVDEIKQQHYWGLVAFFNRSKNVQTKNGPGVSESAIGGFSEFANLEGSSSPNLLAFLNADTIPETRPEDGKEQADSDQLYRPAKLTGDPRVPKVSRRQLFVEKVAAEHPMIARAFVNRIWAALLGRGIVHPFDEMDSMHEPSHPQLLDWLADDFRHSGYNIRRLIKMIVQTKTYQRQSKRPNNVDDPALFAWNITRPLTAEQYARSLHVALRGKVQHDDGLAKSMRQNLADVMPDVATTTIGNALYLSNNPVLNEFISASHGPQHLLTTIKKQPSLIQRMDVLIETAFGRTATSQEWDMIRSFANDPSESITKWEQVVWAIVTSAEFRFNH